MECPLPVELRSTDRSTNICYRAGDSARLQLNRSGAVNVRRALLALAEEHPPIHDETDYP